MKNIIIVILLLFNLLFSGCSAPAGSQKFNNSMNSQMEKSYQAYSIYVFSMLSNFDSSNIVTNSPQIESRKIIDEEDVENQDIDLITFQVEAQYVNSKTTIGRRATLSRYYVTKYGSVYLDSETNRVVELNFKVSDKIDINKDAAQITQEESYAIALNYLNHFGFNSEIAEYELKKFDLQTIGEGTNYCHNFYSYLFTKYIDGVKTTDTCSIGITEYGSLLYYTRGDEIDTSKIDSISIDYKRVESLVNKYAEDICNQINSESIEYTLSSPQMLKLDKETYALSYAIGITYILDGNRLSTGISVVIPVS